MLMISSELNQRSALVLYGSETGNAQDVAEEIGRLTQRLRFDTTVLDLDSIEIVGHPHDYSLWMLISCAA